MTVREILKMGDARLLRIAEPVPAFDTPELHALIADMRETMAAVNGAGLAAPQIGVNLQVVIFGSPHANPRYPGRPLVPPTVLINPVITPLGSDEAQAWEGCLSVPGLRALVAARHGQVVGERAGHLEHAAIGMRDRQRRAVQREPVQIVARALESEAPHFVDYLTQELQERTKASGNPRTRASGISRTRSRTARGW